MVSRVVVDMPDVREMGARACPGDGRLLKANCPTAKFDPGGSLPEFTPCLRGEEWKQVRDHT